MRKFLTIFFTTLLAYAVGFDVGWAAEKTITLDYNSFGLTTSYALKTATVDGFGFTVNQGYKGTGNSIQMNSSKGSGILYNTTAIPGLKSIAVNVSSGNKTYTITTGTSQNPTANSQTGTTGGTYNAVSGDTYFQLKVSGASYFSSIVITYDDSGSTPEPTTYSITGTGTTTGGNVTASATSNIAQGTSVTITATPDTGYELTNLTVDGNDVTSSVNSNNQYTFNMPAHDVAVSATFTEIQSGSSCMTYTPSSASAGTLANAPNSSVTYTSSGFSGFIAGRGAQRTGGNTGTITFSNLSSNYKVTKIEVQYCTNASSGAGTISATLNGSALGDSFTVTKPSSGGTDIKTATLYNNSTGTVFSGNLAISAEATANSLFIYKVLVYYEELAAKAYDVTVATGLTGGSVAASPSGEKVVDSGDQITVTATPATGYDLSAWNITGVSESMTTLGTTNPATVTATGNVNVSANFTQHNYTIATEVNPSNAATDGNTCAVWMQSGFTTINNVATATYGATVSVKLHTSNGWMVDGISITGVNANDITLTNTEDDGKTYSFPMPAQDITITGNFTPYRPTLSMAGRFNGNTGWRTSGGPEFTYNSSNDEYTLDVYFTGEGDGNYFYFRAGNSDLKAANGNESNYGINDNNMSQTHSLGGSRNFEILSGVYTFTVNGALTTLNVTPKTYTIAFSPTSGSEVEQGTQVTASCTLESDINAIKNTDSGAAGDVTVTCNPSTLNTVGANQQVTATATIGNYSVTGNAAYTVVKANLSKTYRRTNTLTVGKKYIIVNEAAAVGFKTGGYEETITINDHQTTLADGSTVIEFTLGGQAGAYTFMSGSKYLQNPSGNTVNVASDEAKTWDVSIDGSYEATMKANATNYYLRYNSGASNNRFRAYASNSTAAAVQLYEQTVEEVKDYTITYATVTGGSATGATGANAGESVTVTVTPDNGYAPSGITVTTSDSNYPTLTATAVSGETNKYQFTVPNDLAANATITVTPQFAQAIAITYVADPAAGGTVTGPASAVYDQQVTVVVTPNADYQLTGLVYSWNNGESSNNIYGTGVGPFSFSMPGTPTTVTATFTKIPHNIVVTSDHGEVTGCPTTATSGTSITFTVNPDAGYDVSSVSGTFNNGNSSLNITDNGDGTYTFSMPAYDVAITVTYFMSDEYELLTDLNDIVEGETYLIVGVKSDGSQYQVMGPKGSNAYASAITVVPDENDIITSTAAMAIVNFVKGEGTNVYAIHTAEGYLSNSGSSNALTTSSNITDNYVTISFAGTDGADAPKIKFERVNTSGNRYLRYNNSATRWAFYSSHSETQYIYKVASTVKRPVIAGTAGQYLGKGNFIGTDEVTITTATQGATIYYTTDGSDPTTSSTLYSDAFSLPSTAVGNTVTVKAIAVSGGETSKIAEQVFTCIRPQKPTFGTNWDGESDVTFYNPMFIYPKRNTGDVDVKAYGAENIYFYRTFDGTTPAVIDANKVTDVKSGEYYIYLDKTVDLSVVKVINGIASEPAEGTLTFAVAAPVFSLAAGSYDGDRQTLLSTETKTTQNNVTWETKMYYTFGNTEFSVDQTTGEVSGGWTLYDAGNPYIAIEAPGTKTLRAVTITNYFNGKSEWHKSEVSEAEYVLSAANLSVIATPAAGTYTYTQHVTFEPKNGIGAVNIYYTTDGTTASSSSTLYTGPIEVASDMTINIYAEDSREANAEGKTFTGEYVYKIGVQAPVFSPLPGNYYTGADGDITVEMFSVSPNAKIYYTTDGSTPSKTNGTLYTGDIPMTQGTHTFKAIAYVGNKESGVTTGTYTISAKLSGNYWQNIAEMNADTDNSTAKTLANPVQVIYMNSYRNDGVTPEFAFVRDNSGYGYIYFGKNATGKQGWHIYQPGDWIKGMSIKGKAAVWEQSYINELDLQSITSTTDKDNWNDGYIGNNPLVPETTTCKDIRDGWAYPDVNGGFTGQATTATQYGWSDGNFADYVTDKNIFGHYVHLRKNTITGTGDVRTGSPAKRSGTITGEMGIPLCYYDGLYIHSGYLAGGNGTTYDESTDLYQAKFDEVQNKGGTFDVYAIVYFYGPYSNDSRWNNAPYEVFPLDFEYTFPAVFHMGSNTYDEQTQEVTIHETKTVTLTCEMDGAQIWYKTSEMEDYEVYEGPITVDKTMTIETYSSYPSKYNDYLESKVYTLIVNLGEVPAPVISPESSLNAVGDPAINVTIGFEAGVEVPEGITIYYTTDDSDPSTSETRMVYVPGETTLSISTTTTVRAIAFLDDFYSPEAEERTYTFVRSNGIIYTLVTSDDDLDENSVYVVVNQAEAMSMQRTQKDNNRDAAPVLFVTESNMPTGHTFAGNLKEVYGNDDLAVFTMRETGTGEWYFHTANGVNNASTGFLYGAVSGSTNQLKTNTADSPTGVQNINWTIEIDADGTAHMFNLYNDQPRYLRFNKSFGLYNTYGSESTGLPVYLYKKEATPLALIEKMGTTEAGHNQYTIADELEIVAANDVLGYIWVKDADASIARTEIKDGQIDYMRDVAASGDADDINVMVDVLKQEGEWDQSNWAIIEVSAARLPAGVSKHSDLVGCRIKPASLTAKYVDDQNYKLTAENSLNDITEALDKRYTPNVYCAANFTSANLNLTSESAGAAGTHDRHYFFVNPKVQEVVTITYAVWDGTNFVLPAKDGEALNGAGLHGAFAPGWTYNTGGTPTLTVGEAYQFTAVVNKPVNGGSGAPRKVAGTGDSPDGTYVVMPMNLSGNGNIVTVVENVKTVAREVVGVEYYNVAGQRSDKPFEGVNIIVTRYDDGTTSTAKVLK